MKTALALCDKSGKFLFEVLPDFFPYGRLTQVEAGLWTKYYEDKREQMKR